MGKHGYHIIAAIKTPKVTNMSLRYFLKYVEYRENDTHKNFTDIQKFSFV